MTVFKGQPIQHPANELLICSSMLTHHRLTHSPPLVLAWPVTGVDSGESVSGHSPINSQTCFLFFHSGLLFGAQSCWTHSKDPFQGPTLTQLRTHLNQRSWTPQDPLQGPFPRTRLNPIKDPPEPLRTLRTPQDLEIRSQVGKHSFIFHLS